MFNFGFTYSSFQLYGVVLHYQQTILPGAGICRFQQTFKLFFSDFCVNFRARLGSRVVHSIDSFSPKFSCRLYPWRNFYRIRFGSGFSLFWTLAIFWNYERKPRAFQRDAAHTKNGGYQPVTLLQAALMIFQ